MADAENNARLDQLQSLVEAALLKRNHSDAERYVVEALSLAPGNPWFMAARVLLNAQRRRWRKTFRAYANALQRAPERERQLWTSLSNGTRTGEGVGFASAKARNLLYLNGLVALALGLGVAGFDMSGWPGLLAALAILLATIVGLELCYRWHLYRRFGISGECHAFPDKDTKSGSATATNLDARVHHPVRGYDLLPNAEFVRVVILDGRVVEANKCTSDRNGNVGFTDECADGEAINILVLGDSFTSFPGNGVALGDLEGVEWPYFLKSGLTEAGFPNVRVLNYARTGHGLLQMADTAVSLLETHQPDVIVFAFITHDITRYRYWHQSHTLGGNVRSMRTLTPGGNVPVHLCEDQILIDRRITWEWARERLQKGDRDSLSNELQRRYDMLRRRTSLRDVDLKSLRRLYALDWVFFGTPFIDVNTRTVRSGLKKMSEDSFAGDAQFIDAFNKIKQSGAQIVFLQLPLLEELEQGKTLTLSRNQHSLMQSLTEITGENVWAFVPQLDKDFLRRKYPRTPHDDHPSLWAQKFFGEAVVQMVCKTALGAKFRKREARDALRNAARD